MYRRLRGEVPFTLAEAAAISQKMGVSLDKLAGTNVDSNAIFDLNIIRQTDPLETYYSIVDNYVKIFRDLNHDPASELCTSSNMIPQTFYLKYELLSKFRMFKWIYQFEKIDIGETFRGYRDRRQIVGKAQGVRAGISGVSAHGVYMG